MEEIIIKWISKLTEIFNRYALHLEKLNKMRIKRLNFTSAFILGS